MRPGQKREERELPSAAAAAALQGTQPLASPGDPAVPALHPRQALLAEALPAAGTSGGWQARGTQAAPSCRAGGAGWAPTEHTAGRARHWVAEEAPVELVEVPLGQRKQSAAEEALGQR